jgi:hypothetical protein
MPHPSCLQESVLLMPRRLSIKKHLTSSSTGGCH